MNLHDESDVDRLVFLDDRSWTKLMQHIKRYVNEHGPCTIVRMDLRSNGFPFVILMRGESPNDDPEKPLAPRRGRPPKSENT